MDRKEVQIKALTSWLEYDKKGTFELATGTGKTIAALLCLSKMPTNDGKVHIFLAETTAREKDLNEDIENFKEWYGIDLRKLYNIQFRCYQGVYNLKGYEFGLVIADEIHNGLTPEYFKFFQNNTYDAIVCLSATIDQNTSYVDDFGIKTTKGEMLNTIAPICFTYTMADALRDGIGREIDVYVIINTLDDVNKNVLAGSAKNKFYQTQKKMYEYLDKAFKRSFFSKVKNKEVIIASTYRKRSVFLSTIPQRIDDAKILCASVAGKTIVFGNNLESILKVTNNTVSSKNTDEVNDKIRSDFDNDRISTIGSFKKLKQGANLKNIDNVLLLSYYNSEGDLIQQIGRLRKNKNGAGKVFIFTSSETYEEELLQKIISNIPYRSIQYFKNAAEVLQKIKDDVRKP